MHPRISPRIPIIMGPVCPPNLPLFNSPFYMDMTVSKFGEFGFDFNMGSISPVPSPAPSAVPTPVPTTDDTVAIATSMTMVGLDASAVTDDDIQAIRVGIAKIMNGIKKSMIKNVKVTAKSRRRQLLSDSAEVSFDSVARRNRLYRRRRPS